MKTIRPFTTAGFCNHLEENILPYWVEHSLDSKNGGFYGQINADNSVSVEADKSLLLNARILWSFSEAFFKLQDLNYKTVADRAYNYLKSYFIDEERGGVYWMLDYQGKVIDSSKLVFAQAYAIYAFSSYHKVSGDKDALMLAIELYHLVEEYAFNEEVGGYVHTLNENWEVIATHELTRDEMNLGSHLHLMEAYTNLANFWEDERLVKSLRYLVNLISAKLVKDSGHVILSVDRAWMPKDDSISYGHDIECGWLMLRAAEEVNDDDLVAEISELMVKMTKAGLKGIDDTGLLSISGNDQGILDESKQWWQQLEAMVGLTIAGQITEDSRYLTLAKSLWERAQLVFFDEENGEWFDKASKTGQIALSEPKIGPWKAPYHITRAMLELTHLLKNI